jgi:hypothetical protein
MLLPPRLGPYFHCQKSSNDIFSSKQIITGISEYTDSVVSARKYQLNNIYFHINKGQSPRSSINQMTHGRHTCHLCLQSCAGPETRNGKGLRHALVPANAHPAVS